MLDALNRRQLRSWGYRREPRSEAISFIVGGEMLLEIITAPGSTGQSGGSMAEADVQAVNEDRRCINLPS